MSATLKELKLRFVGIGGLNILCNVLVQIDRVMLFIVAFNVGIFRVRGYGQVNFGILISGVFYVVRFKLNNRSCTIAKMEFPFS